MSNENNERYKLESGSEPIKGFPILHWKGKHAYTETQYYPAQLKEKYVSDSSCKKYVDKDGVEKDWINKIFWGDNIQVMSHMLKDYMGKIDLIYIDPPFDSKADYKKKIKIKGEEIKNDLNSFEEKQYGDIWANDDYFQFMYERFILLKKLLSETGSIYVHMDENKSHYIKAVLDEVFGPQCFKREIIWRIGWISGYKSAANQWIRNHDTILYYTKSNDYTFNKKYIPYPADYRRRDGAKPEGQGYPIEDTWNCSELDTMNSIQIMSFSGEKVGYPTQKNENLLQRIIEASSNPGDLVFDCFMGSGTTQAVAMKLGRRFLGADINLGAVHTTTKRLLNIQKELESNSETKGENYTDFEIYNVNNYDLFRNPVEAKEILLDALNVNKFDSGNVYDGELDGYMVKIMNVNRITTKADLETFRANLPFKTFEERKAENPNKPVEKILLVCMGHEPDLKAAFEEENLSYKLDIKICDILTDKKDLTFKREAEADIRIKGNKLVIKNFYPLNLLQKLSLDKKEVDDWKQLVEEVLIDFNYDGKVLKPEIIDIPDKKDFVKGEYDIPDKHGKIKVKITDLLSESLEVEVGDNG
ncbi:MAG: site-specific DNA-methyltransferase [Lachnospiraceae bacterium]|nr:site-specific DNA-methyltransferase [Lachnospiraceae bacterium]